MKPLLIKVLVVFTVIFPMIQVPGLLCAGWQGPKTILAGQYGEGVGQFFFDSSDIMDFFPRNFGVDNVGNIFINDEGRVQIFNENGELKKIVVKPTELDGLINPWPSEIYVHPSGAFVADSGNQDTSFFDDSYNHIKTIKLVGEIYAVDNGYIVAVDEDQYAHYSVDGVLIANYSKIPEVYEKKLIENRVNNGSVEIKYNGKVFSFNSNVDISAYFFSEDMDFVYTYYGGYIDKYDQCGKRLGHWESPNWLVFNSGSSQSQEPYEFIHTEYGVPIVVGNGNVFTYEKTPQTYSILKWEWVDAPDDPKGGPDAPASLLVQPSIDGLYLTWAPSPQDPGCVDGYEVESSTTVDGIFTTISTSDPGVLKFNDTGALPGTTYYYKVRAKSGSEYSDYTAEVSGKRP
jgi:hypothetical protein